jgi:DNA-binding transcriptional regulator YdaS (Cro superfamily)
MKLGQYFKDQCINHNNFARKVGVSPITICNILSQKGGIQLATAVRIEEITEGKVTCKDLVNPISMKTLELKAKHLMKEKL